MGARFATCSKCGKIKKGHICTFDMFKKPNKVVQGRAPYKCSLCGELKKGHTCQFAF
jgi:hypothetical protein